MDWQDSCVGILAREGSVYLSVYLSFGVFYWRVRDLNGPVLGEGSCDTEEKAKTAAEECYAAR